jgi:hypothetical protein
MNATALALPTPLPALGLQHHTAPPLACPVAGLALLAASCVEQTAELMRAACRRGQLEDASAAARIAMPLAAAHSPHKALLRVLAEAQPALMVAPEERRLYSSLPTSWTTPPARRRTQARAACISSPHASAASSR